MIWEIKRHAQEAYNDSEYALIRDVDGNDIARVYDVDEAIKIVSAHNKAIYSVLTNQKTGDR